MTPAATRRVRAICARRDHHDMTNRQLADALGMSPTTTWRVLTGRTTPGPAFADAYAHVFGDDALADLYGTTEAAA